MKGRLAPGPGIAHESARFYTSYCVNVGSGTVVQQNLNYEVGYRPVWLAQGVVQGRFAIAIEAVIWVCPLLQEKLDKLPVAVKCGPIQIQVFAKI